MSTPATGKRGRRRDRVHVEAPLEPGARIVLPDPAAQHLLRVLRLREGDDCVLFNGDGNDYPSRIVAAGKRGGEVEIVGREAVDNESPLPITLVQGIARGEKMDLILQKATELGAVAFVPVSSQRSEVKLDPARAAKRLEHWRSVVASACAQSGRARVPAVQPPQPLGEALDGLVAGGTGLLLDPFAPIGLDDISMPRAAGGFTVAVGPEGGWSDADRSALQAAGFTGVRMGPRVLRTETAGFAAVAILQARFGDLGR
ncbi:MAG: 16S rRNA (uracil(1498)-N(3))-methyltransferase [Gammaproteobacteria bacterium]|mgnify:CR=1 FL=1|nr:16S rRNA (uracil(1498)-N(3))-methyltransferase [Gammaproteobacteria bacterium]